MNLMFRTLTIAALVALAACGTTKPGAPASGEPVSQSPPTQAQGEKIGQRAVLRWENIINKKLDAAYDMLSPGYRQTHDKAEYAQAIANRPVRWTKASYIGHECESPDVCAIQLSIAFNIMMPSVGTVGSESVVVEKWLRVENEWFFFPDRVGK